MVQSQAILSENFFLETMPFAFSTFKLHYLWKKNVVAASHISI